MQFDASLAPSHFKPMKDVVRMQAASRSLHESLFSHALDALPERGPSKAQFESLSLLTQLNRLEISASHIPSISAGLSHLTGLQDLSVTHMYGQSMLQSYGPEPPLEQSTLAPLTSLTRLVLKTHKYGCGHWGTSASDSWMPADLPMLPALKQLGLMYANSNYIYAPTRPSYESIAALTTVTSLSFNHAPTGSISDSAALQALSGLGIFRPASPHCTVHTACPPEPAWPPGSQALSHAGAQPAPPVPPAPAAAGHPGTAEGWCRHRIAAQHGN